MLQCALLVLLLVNSCSGRSLHFAPSVLEIRVDSGNEAALQCVLDGDSTHGGSFSWTGPAVASSRAVITLDSSGMVSTLSIAGIDGSDEGRYSCSFTGVGTISITLDVVFNPHFLNVSEYQEFIEETDAVVECPAFFGEPQGTMVWTRDGVVITGDRFTPEDGRMRIQNIQESDGGVYRCSIRLLGIVDSKFITVNIVERNSLAPRIVESSNPIEVVYGNPLNITCQLEEQRDNVHYTWTVDTDYEQSHRKNATPSLHRDADDFLEGRYTCKAENIYGYDEQMFHVRILAPPEPLKCTEDDETRNEGDTVVLKHCELTSPVQLSELDFQWSVQNGNGEWEMITPGGRFSVNHKGFLTISNVQPFNSGLYRVNISNNQGSALHRVRLQVTPGPTPAPSLYFAPSVPEISVDSGNNAVLQCVLDHGDFTHEGSFSWTGPAVASGRAVIDSSGTVSTLTIDNVGRSDEGQYSCSFTGVESVSISLDVVFDPHFLDVPENQEFIEETDAVVECPAFFGDPPGNNIMVWTHNNTNAGITDERFIPEDGRLTILNIGNGDEGVYRCAINRLGIVDSRFITVNIIERDSLAPRIVEPLNLHPLNPIEVVYWDSLDLNCRLEVQRDDVYYTWTVDTSLTSELSFFTNTTPEFHRDVDKFVGGRYTCRVENSYGYDEQIFFVTILVPPPLPATCSKSMIGQDEGSTVILGYCDLTSPVRPSKLQFRWRVRKENGEVVNISSEGRFEVSLDGLLTIKDTLPSDSGLYQITITNKYGSALHSVHLQLYQLTRPIPNEALVGGILGGLFIIMAVAAIGGMLAYRKKKLQANVVIKNDSNLSLSKKEFKCVADDHTYPMAFAIQSSSIPDILIVSASNIQLSESIGQGEFGIVYKGYIIEDTTDIVAIKTLKGFYDHSTSEELVRECIKMKDLNHPNILRLIGICVDGGPAPFIITPFMENGSLLSYLRRNRNTFLSTEDNMKPVLKQLMDMCLQVAKGMEYLASMKIVHRDLAARNCMIGMNLVIKVADFGLAEMLGNKEYFRQDKTVAIKLPLRWLAPESLEDHVFSEKSDVWAYGVTCWEIFSGGKVPYPGVNVSDLLWLLKNGQSLDKPENSACSNDMYLFMSQCWELEPKRRPPFSELVQSLSATMETMAGYVPLCKETSKESEV